MNDIPTREQAIETAKGQFALSPLIVPDETGKPIFLGAESPHNPPMQEKGPCDHGTDTCFHVQCPRCHGWFDYLVGDVYQGCETCYDVAKDRPTEEKPEDDGRVEEVIPTAGS